MGESMKDCPICARVGGALVECSVCHKRKAPLGRAAPLSSDYCDRDCGGYRADPQPEELWPGEKYGDALGHMDWHETRSIIAETKP